MPVTLTQINVDIQYMILHGMMKSNVMTGILLVITKVGRRTFFTMIRMTDQSIQWPTTVKYIISTELFDLVNIVKTRFIMKSRLLKFFIKIGLENVEEILYHGYVVTAKAVLQEKTVLKSPIYNELSFLFSPFLNIYITSL